MGETRRFAEVGVGDALPALPIELTTSLIVAGAVASQDYTPVHHDKKAAQAAGMQDVFMNILTTNGLVSRFVTDWAGPDARVTHLSVKLGTPNLPGDTMTLTGSVREKDDAAEAVVVDVTVKNAWGNHVTGSVKVILAAGD
ncbi:MAG: MaoC/PaaZ C-terminal domain-containing protein [Myxococcota bacterium]|nr:MaoC/PaaZ C-terminal domain-containing protein [Myxococcota bacterium]